MVPELSQHPYIVRRVYLTMTRANVRLPRQRSCTNLKRPWTHTNFGGALHVQKGRLSFRYEAIRQKFREASTKRGPLELLWWSTVASRPVAHNRCYMCFEFRILFNFLSYASPRATTRCADYLCWSSCQVFRLLLSIALKRRISLSLREREFDGFRPCTVRIWRTIKLANNFGLPLAVHYADFVHGRSCCVECEPFRNMYKTPT